MSQLNNEEKKNITDELLEKATEENVEPIAEIKDDESNKENVETKEEKTIFGVEEVKKEETAKEQPVDKQKQNEEKMNINMVKNKGSKKLIIFLIIFTIIAILITALLISHKNKGQSQDILDMPQEENEIVVENDKTELVDESHLAIKSITELYSENSITIEEKEIKYGKVKDENGEEVYKVNITYPQISGLKNKTVQDKINKEIKEKVLSYYDESVLKDSKIVNFSANGYVRANYGDVLSIEIVEGYTKQEKNGEENYDYKSYSLNYRLDTGKQIVFNDLFINTANMDNIIQQALYKSLMDKIKYSEESDSTEENEFLVDYANADYSELESEMLKYIKLYREKGPEYFYFLEDRIYLGIFDIELEIKMEAIMQDIAIYKRFLSKETLYEDKSKGTKNIFVFNYPKTNYLKEGQYLDNLYIEVDTNIEYESKNGYYYDDPDYIKKCNETTDKFLKDYIDKAKNNPQTAYIIQGYIDVNNSEIKDVVEISKSYSYTTMSKDYYDKEGKNIFAQKQKATRDSLDETEIFDKQDSTKDIKVEEIYEEYYADNKYNKLSFLDMQKNERRFDKISKIEVKELPSITKEGNYYIFDFMDLYGYTDRIENTNENIRNKEISDTTKVSDYTEEQFEKVKEEVKKYLKETINVDVTNKLKQLEIRRSNSAGSNQANYEGGYYILIRENGGIQSYELAKAILEYVITQSNTSSDNLFVDANGKEQNRRLKITLAERIAAYIYLKYTDEGYSDYDTKVMNLLLDIYGEELLKDAFYGRESVVEKDFKQIVDETIYDACMYTYISYSDLQQCYITLLNKLQIKKGVSYDCSYE